MNAVVSETTAFFWRAFLFGLTLAYVAVLFCCVLAHRYYRS
jgi:hypothetical protein